MSEQIERAKAIITTARQDEVEWTELESSIAAELDTARSDLARKVLAEVEECMHSIAGNSQTPYWQGRRDEFNLYHDAIINLFTREGIDTEKLR